MRRPHMNKSGDEIRSLVEEHWDDFTALGVVAYEIQFRDLIDNELKADVVERLVELGLEMIGTITAQPDFEFPDTDIYETRRRNAPKFDNIDWDEQGLLRLSGYRVGKTRGRPRNKRRRILNFIFLEDDLRDVDDLQYAAQWGRPMTSDRLQKLAETIAAFTRNAKRNRYDMSQAISDWENDLDYLKSTFYDRWGDFPWPDVVI